MTKAISITVLLGSAVAIAFGSSPLFCIIAAIIALAVFIFDLFLFKKSKIKKPFLSVISFPLVVFCLFIPSVSEPYGNDDYCDKVNDYIEALSEKHNSKAERIYEEIVKQYGETDDIRYFKGVSLIAKSDADGADEVLYSFENTSDMKYYLLKDNIITLRNSDNDENLVYELRNLYREAAKNVPDWEYALKRAGVSYLEDSSYEQACYYLTKAFTLSEDEDGEAAYYLGVALFEQGLYEEAFNMFEKAYYAGVSEEMEGYIATYCSYVNNEEDAT